MLRPVPRKPKTRHPLRNVREAAGLTQPQLAKRVGVSAVTIEKIENGTKALSEQLARKLGMQLGCHISIKRNAEGKRSWCVSDQMSHGYGQSSPYTREDFVAYERKRQNPPVAADRLGKNLGAAILLLLKSAERSGRLAVLSLEIDEKIRDLMTSFKLEDPLKGWLRDEGFSEEQAQHLFECLMLWPDVGGHEYLELARVAAEARESAGQKAELDAAKKPISKPPATSGTAPAGRS